MSGGYSGRWRAEFEDVEPARTASDVEFLRRVLPQPAFRRILDVPCGAGRLLRALRAEGYDVTGADIDPAVAPHVVCDLRELDRLSGDYDAAINMWASFGYFDESANEHVLSSFGRRVRPGGRVVLDLFNRAFFESRQGRREVRPGIVERSTVLDGRRRCELTYDDGSVDAFEWQLYAPDELESMARRHGLTPVETIASPDRPSMQLVLQREP